MYRPLLVYIMTWLMADSIWRLKNLGNTELFQWRPHEDLAPNSEFRFPPFQRGFSGRIPRIPLVKFNIFPEDNISSDYSFLFVRDPHTRGLGLVRVTQKDSFLASFDEFPPFRVRIEKENLTTKFFELLRNFLWKKERFHSAG